MGGVDLSEHVGRLFGDLVVPARVGGVDLSTTGAATKDGCSRPRPCGRGGFKPFSDSRAYDADCVPARVGGVDLSMWEYGIDPAELRPRPCGRGGFKLTYASNAGAGGASPPVWAGWI